jgi:hypothetical protein
MAFSLISSNVVKAFEAFCLGWREQQTMVKRLYCERLGVVATLSMHE